MDALVLDLVKDGKDINEVLNMPFHFMLELLAEKINLNKQNP